MNELYKAFLYIVLGAFICFFFSEQYAGNKALKIIEEVANDEWVSAKSNLVLATAIRNGKSNEALEFTENQMVMNVNAFTNKGKKLNELSEYEKSIIRQIKEYWEKDCKKECLHAISQILSDEKHL